jgi:hypothetical protein
MPTATTPTAPPVASACCAPLGPVSLSDQQAEATARLFKAPQPVRLSASSPAAWRWDSLGWPLEERSGGLWGNTTVRT